CRKATVREVAPVPVGGIVAPRFPGDVVARGQPFIEGSDPHAFDATELFDAPALGRLLPEAELEHLADDLEAGIRIEGEARLVEQAVRAGAARLTGGIEAYACFSHPDEQSSGSGRESRSCMRNPDARLEHQAGDPSDGYVDADAVLV